MINIQKYIKASSLEEAYQLNQAKNNRIIGGMLWIKTGTGNCNTAIDLCNLGLDKIEESEDGFTIGAYVTLSQLEKDSSFNKYTNGIAAAAVKDIVGVQFRNMATVGGSIWGRYGFSDVLTLFLSMNTTVELYKAGLVPLAEFINMKYDSDLLVRLHVKKQSGAFVYSAVRAQRTDFPVLTCAVSKLDDMHRVVIGARPGHAIPLDDAEGILANGLNTDSIKAFAEYAAATIPTGSNLRGSAEYRTHLIKVLTERNLIALGGNS